ncbi:Na+/H+ antiporter subunit D [Paenibacillus sp. YYML68]|uniref:Na+/H+ antiporter subunit D n=1 Tax=Paenibacillus sp. YYML68 TaxID=2909250 RepID=UPI0024918B25|nr:Na+/H+ antiporter subunit D [Paenibacillus sp. YYML68]
MNNWVVAPLFIPLLTGIVLIFFNRRETQRAITGASVLANIAAAAYLVYSVRHDGIQTLHMSGWEPPFGIVFVADMFAALLVLTTTIIGAACSFYAFHSIGEAKENHYFYTFTQFLLVGVIGSFLTGDIFNLFVCFEVMLISSYALITLGGRKEQLRESLKYMLVNILSSALFVASVAYLYAVTGTLNMAHLAERVAQDGQGGILTLLSILFLIVFGLKAGLLLFFWLPGSYRTPPAAITALFGGLLTKVGVYAIIRIFTLIFYHQPETTHSLISWMAAATMVLGVIGAVAYRDVGRILIYNIVVSVGFICFGLSVANEAALQGVVFYLVHDMIAKALLFLLGGSLVALAGTDRLKQMGGLIKQAPVLGWMLFAAAMAIVGVPPLSGFVGKLLIVQGGLEGGHYVVTAISLASSLLVLYSMMTLFMHAFWGKPAQSEAGAPASANKLDSRLLAPSAALLALVVLLGLGAEWVFPYVNQAAEVLLEPQQYIQAVLRGE